MHLFTIQKRDGAGRAAERQGQKARHIGRDGQLGMSAARHFVGGQGELHFSGRQRAGSAA